MFTSKQNALQPEQSAQDFYVQGKSWYQENYESIACSKNRYQLLAISLGLLLGLSLLAIIIMMPLKKYTYRMIEVNKQTGEITVLKELEGNTFTANWAINRYFINQYLQLRQGYSLDDIKRRFNLVLSMSNSQIGKEYSDNTFDTNPTSPIVLLNKDFYRDVQVLSINQLNDNTAMARFKTITHNKNIPTDVKTEDWQVVLKWEYVNAPQSQQERDKNPLGFHITYYQLSPVFVDN